MTNMVRYLGEVPKKLKWVEIKAGSDCKKVGRSVCRALQNPLSRHLTFTLHLLATIKIPLFVSKQSQDFAEQFNSRFWKVLIFILSAVPSKTKDDRFVRSHVAHFTFFHTFHFYLSV